MTKEGAMAWLGVATLIWAFSFGLIKSRLTGLPALEVSLLRLFFALLVFLPLWRWRAVAAGRVLALAAIGAVQFGLMYVLYIASFRYLPAYQVALYTVLTPIWVVLLEGGLIGRLRARNVLAALLAVAGAAVVAGGGDPRGSLAGFLLVQGSNLSFAAGQVAYRRLMDGVPAETERKAFAWPLFGALVFLALVSLPGTGPRWLWPTTGQWLVLGYLGVVASGIAFFCWNHGAVRVSSGLLAVMNNAKIPLGVLVALLVFGEHGSPPRLALSLALMGASLALVAPNSGQKKTAGSELPAV